MEGAGLRGSAVGVAAITAAGAVLEGKGLPSPHSIAHLSSEQRKVRRESTSSFEETHFCLTSLGRKFEDCGPELQAGEELQRYV